MTNFDQFTQVNHTLLATSENAHKLAETYRADAKIMSALYTQIENAGFMNDRVHNELLGRLESFRLTVLEMAEDAEERAEDIEIDERDDAGYRDGIRFDYNVGIGSI